MILIDQTPEMSMYRRLKKARRSYWGEDREQEAVRAKVPHVINVFIHSSCPNTPNGCRTGPEPVPDFRVSHIVGILQPVLPGQASTQPLDHAVAQNLQVTSPARNWKHKASQPLHPPSTTPFTSWLVDSSGTQWVTADRHLDSFLEWFSHLPLL